MISFSWTAFLGSDLFLCSKDSGFDALPGPAFLGECRCAEPFGCCVDRLRVSLLSNEVISACSPASPIRPCWNLALACIVLL